MTLSDDEPKSAQGQSESAKGVETWQQLWRRFERIRAQRVAILKALRETIQPEGSTVETADILRQSMDRDRYRLLVVENQNDLTRLQAHVVDCLDALFERDPDHKAESRPLDESTPVGSR